MKRIVLSVLFLFATTVLLLAQQYIGTVYTYKPAPGQFINVSPWGVPAAMETLIGGAYGSMSLGSFGGYVIFGFDEPVENDPDNPYGVDFTIFGNAYDDWSEPAVVYVMRDENGNRLPDDQWYELAGSDYFFSTSRRGYAVTYSNPGGGVAANVPWTDNLGNSGEIVVNEFHLQPWYPQPEYFPEVSTMAYTLTGSFVRARLDTTNPYLVRSCVRAFGYADNYKRGSGPHTLPNNPYTKEIENSGADGFDISWAVDETGQYVDLEAIDFVKVQSAALENAGWLGELSPELGGAIDIPPNASITGENRMLVVADLPVICTSTEWPLEYLEFVNGRKQSYAAVAWSVSGCGGYVDDNDVLHVSTSGELTLTANSLTNPGLTWSQSCLVDIPSSLEENVLQELEAYPIPASDYLYLHLPVDGEVALFSIHGRREKTYFLQAGDHRLNLASLSPGMWILVAEGEDCYSIVKLVVQR